jgi:hypothetical protein
VTNTERADTHAALEAAIDQYAKYWTEGEVVTDAVLIIAAQHVDDDGDRCGRVFLFPRNGYQPEYITKGLLITSLDMMRRREPQRTDSE